MNPLTVEFKPGLLDEIYNHYFPLERTEGNLSMSQSTKSIAIVQFAHLNSERVPNKMLQVIGGATLIERACEYMLKLSSLRENVTPYLIMPDSDAELVKAVKQYIDCPLADGIKLRLMTADQSNARIWSEMIKPYIDEFRQYDWSWDANIACHPFLSIKTGLQIIDDLQCESPQIPKVYCIAERNPLWDHKGFQFYNTGKLADTKQNDIYFKPSHIAHCYPPECLEYNEEQMANSLYPIVINPAREEQIDIDTPDDLALAQRIAPHHYQMPQLGAIAMGSGPSFYEWAASYESNPLTYPSPREQGRVISPTLYGSGVTSLHINGIMYYGLGDIIHIDHVPDGRATDPHHPGCTTYAGTRNLQDKKSHGEYTPPLLPYADLDIPHGESSGGMAISMACLHHDVVGIIGFDGHREPFPSDEAYWDFVRKTRTLINYWQNRGRRIVSLMSDSVFNSITEPAIVPLKYRDLGRVV